MGTVIKQRAGVEDIVRHVRKTLTSAAGCGSPYREDAARFLGSAVAYAEEIARRLSANLEAVEPLEGRQRAQNHRADDAIAGIKDELYNVIGRRGRDPVFRLIYPNGADTYRAVPATAKPEALEMNAQAIELVRHPGIPPAVARDAAAELRAEAAALEVINTALAPKRTEQRFLTMQFVVNARRAQTDLARLKEYWKSQGETEHDIHLMIPSAPTGRSGQRELVTPEGMIAAALGVLVIGSADTEGPALVDAALATRAEGS